MSDTCCTTIQCPNRKTCLRAQPWDGKAKFVNHGGKNAEKCSYFRSQKGSELVERLNEMFGGKK